MIADRRVELERSAVDKENEEKWRTEQAMKKQMILEAKRLETELQEREKKRLEAEKQEIHQRRLKERMAQIVNTPFGKKVVQKLEEEDLTKLDVETVLQKQQEEMAKEAKEHMSRMRAQEKRLDHLERAKRIEEIAVIQKHVQEKKEREKAEWEVYEAERIAHVIEERKISVANRDRMKRMIEDKDTFLQSLLDARRHVYEGKLVEFQKRLDEERAIRLAERKRDRKEERRQKYMAEKAEEERRRQEEARRIEEEAEREEERRAMEERKKEQEELAKKNQITFEKQQARLREIEEREKGDKETFIGGADKEKSAPEPWRPKSLRTQTASVTASPAPANDSPTSVPTAGKWVPRSLSSKKAMMQREDGAEKSYDPIMMERMIEREDRETEASVRSWLATDPDYKDSIDSSRDRDRMDNPRDRNRMDPPRDRNRMDAPRDRDRMDPPRDRDRMDAPRDRDRMDAPRGRERFEDPEFRRGPSRDFSRTSVSFNVALALLPLSYKSYHITCDG